MKMLISCNHLNRATSPLYTIVSRLSSTTKAASPDNITTVTTSPEAAAPEETVPEIAVTEATSDIKDEQDSDCARSVEVVESLPVEKEGRLHLSADVVPVPQEDDPVQLLQFLEDLIIIKRNREEFVARVEQLKKEVIG